MKTAENNWDRDETSGGELTVVRAVLAAIADEREVGSLLDEILSVLLAETGVTDGLFVLLRDGELAVEAAAGPLAGKLVQKRFPAGTGVSGRAVDETRTVILGSAARDAGFAAGPLAGHRGACVAVPIAHRGRMLGALCVLLPKRSEAELRRAAALFEIVGAMAADAVSMYLRIEEEHGRLAEENRKLRDMLEIENPGDLVGNCREMKNIYTQIRQVAPTDATVLIRGATGTGKELVARAIVNLSARRNKPFVTLNCAALPEALVESELFGHEKGAFTGATDCRIGRVEAADGGTLFLDEIGDLSPQTQVKLLRLLQERTFSRIGSNRELHADVRFLAATGRDLERLMGEGKFREDLYYRLNIFPISLPELGKRRSDIILLADHFIARMNARYHKHIARLSTPAINMLMAYHWPGNVRELENCIERAVLTASDDCIHGYDLPPSLQTGRTAANAAAAPFEVMVASYQREIIVGALKRSRGKLAGAARELGLSSRMLHYYVKKLGITPAWYVSKA